MSVPNVGTDFFFPVVFEVLVRLIIKFICARHCPASLSASFNQEGRAGQVPIMHAVLSACMILIFGALYENSWPTWNNLTLIWDLFLEFMKKAKSDFGLQSIKQWLNMRLIVHQSRRLSQLLAGLLYAASFAEERCRSRREPLNAPPLGTVTFRRFYGYRQQPSPLTRCCTALTFGPPATPG